MSGWQPIETAPKDGSYVLVYPGIWTGVSCSVARWNEGKCKKTPRPYWDRLDSYGSILRNRQYKPTHWQPLPEPPK